MRTLLLLGIALIMTGGVVSGQNFKRGDANVDGYVDIADGDFLLNSLFVPGSPFPTCQDAADADNSGALNITDGIYIYNFLFLGGPAPPAPGALACGPDTVGDSLAACVYPPGACTPAPRTTNGDYVLGWEAPLLVIAAVDGIAEFTAYVRLDAAAQDVSAWSLAVAPEDPSRCQIIDATSANTVSADITDSPPGLRNTGFEKTELTTGAANEGAVMGLDLALIQDSAAPASGVPHRLLQIQVRADVSGENQCVPCRIIFKNGLTGNGAPVENLLVVDGEAIAPTLMPLDIEICPFGVTPTTAVTYQGRLMQQDQPVDGSRDLRFRLFAESAGGAQIGPDNVLPSQSIQDGFFTVALGFGDHVYDQNRWLEIAVAEPNQLLVTLSPRQPLHAAPRSYYAQRSGEVDWAGILSIPPGFADGVDDVGSDGADHVHTSLDAADGSPVDALIVNNDGNVGIGTTDPQAALEIDAVNKAALVIQRNQGNFADTRAQMTISSNFGPQGLRVLMSDDDGANYTDTLFLADTTDVGIGTTVPSEKLHVIGNFCATGTIGACSDERFKKNVTGMSGALDKVSRLRGVQFDWRQREFPDHQFSDERQAGFIAQELKDIYPEAVQQGSDGAYSVDYGRLTPLLVEAIKEQQRVIGEKSDKIETLERRLAALENIVLQIENSVVRHDRIR